MTRLVLSELFVTNYCLSTNKNLLVSRQFPGPYGVTKYGSGWRKDVVNQCLEFGSSFTSFFPTPVPNKHLASVDVKQHVYLPVHFPGSTARCRKSSIN